MAQVEAKAKRKHMKALGDSATSAIVEVTVDEAKENGKWSK